MVARIARLVALAALAAGFGCTPATSASSDAESGVEVPRLSLGYMYWGPSCFILGDDHALVFGALVEDTTSRPAERPEIRGDTVDEASLRVERVFHQHAPPDAPPLRPPPRLRTGDLVTTDAASGVRPGDRVLVFATSYEGGYAILPKRGTTTPLGIVVSSWSDPIVAATQRWLAGSADLRDETDAAAWRPYGEAAIACALDGIPACHCDASDE